MRWWAPSTPALNAMLLAVHQAGGYDCIRHEWWRDPNGQPLARRIEGRPWAS